VSTTRVLALDALVRIEDGAYANLLLPELLRRRDLEARDRAFVTDLVYSTVRQQRALDFVLARFSSRAEAERYIIERELECARRGVHRDAA